MPLADLPGRIKGSNPNEVRSVVDKLVTHLALVEDLQPETWELMVGFLPAVREELIRASKPRERPPLLVCERPKEIGPDGSPIVNDLRAVLLEVASEPPRLRQDQALFHKEIERFQAALEPLAAWLLDALKWSDEGRLNQALAWARTLKLVKDVSEGKQLQLHLTPKGYQWLSSGLDEQYTGIYDLLRTLPARNDFSHSPYPGLDFPGLVPDRQPRARRLALPRRARDGPESGEGKIPPEPLGYQARGPSSLAERTRSSAGRVEAGRLLSARQCRIEPGLRGAQPLEPGARPGPGRWSTGSIGRSRPWRSSVRRQAGS